MAKRNLSKKGKTRRKSRKTNLDVDDHICFLGVRIKVCRRL